MNCTLKPCAMNSYNEETMQARTQLLIGREGVEALRRAHVMVVGLGGVGGTAAEALCRSGIGMLTLVDGDTVALSNLNRQIVAERATLGQNKALALAQRMRAIAPQCRIMAVDTHFTAQNAEALLGHAPDFIIDAIDSMEDKLCLIAMAYEKKINIVSATGAGNRLDLQKLKLADLYQTVGDPVCRILRRELKKRGVFRHPVVYSEETPLKKGRPTGSMMFVPSAMGLLLAQYTVEQLRSKQ